MLGLRKTLLFSALLAGVAFTNGCSPVQKLSAISPGPGVTQASLDRDDVGQVYYQVRARFEPKQEFACDLDNVPLIDEKKIFVISVRMGDQDGGYESIVYKAFQDKGCYSYTDTFAFTPDIVLPHRLLVSENAEIRINFDQLYNEQSLIDLETVADVLGGVGDVAALGLGGAASRAFLSKSQTLEAQVTNNKSQIQRFFDQVFGSARAEKSSHADPALISVGDKIRLNKIEIRLQSTPYEEGLFAGKGPIAAPKDIGSVWIIPTPIYTAFSSLADPAEPKKLRLSNARLSDVANVRMATVVSDGAFDTPGHTGVMTRLNVRYDAETIGTKIGFNLDSYARLADSPLDDLAARCRDAATRLIEFGLSNRDQKVFTFLMAMENTTVQSIANTIRAYHPLDRDRRWARSEVRALRSQINAAMGDLRNKLSALSGVYNACMGGRAPKGVAGWLDGAGVLRAMESDYAFLDNLHEDTDFNYGDRMGLVMRGVNNAVGIGHYFGLNDQNQAVEIGGLRHYLTQDASMNASHFEQAFAEGQWSAGCYTQASNDQTDTFLSIMHKAEDQGDRFILGTWILDQTRGLPVFKLVLEDLPRAYVDRLCPVSAMDPENSCKAGGMDSMFAQAAFTMGMSDDAIAECGVR